MIADSYFEIDYNTRKLIRIFESGTYKNWSKDDLKWEISQLNEYQFLYTLNSILTIYEYTDTNKSLAHFFEDDYIYCFFTKSFDEFGEGVDGVFFNCIDIKSTKLSESLYPENNILEWLYFTNKIENELIPLSESLANKFKNLENKFNNDILVRLEPNVVKHEPYHDENGVFLGNKYDHFVYYSNIYSVIRNDLMIDYIKFGTDYAKMHKFYGRIKANCIKFKKLNPNNDNFNHNSFIVYSLCYSIENWKSLVFKMMKEKKSVEKFSEQLSFFIECLNQLKLLSGKNFIKHDLYNDNEVNSVSDIDKMIQWITKSFVSPKEIKVLNDFSTEKNNFNIDVNKHLLSKLYTNLTLNDFIDENKTSKNEFIQVLIEDWGSHNSFIYLNLDHFQTKIFIDEFNDKFKVKLSYSKIEKAQNIKNNNGPVRQSLLSSSSNKNRVDFRPENKIERDNLLKKIIKNV